MSLRDRVPGSDERRTEVAGNPARLHPRARWRVQTKDALLAAAVDGWGATLRYALLMIIRRGTVCAGAWLLYESEIWRVLH